MSYLNELRPNQPRKAARRVGRGVGSGFGKTCGRGHKGQHSRAGGFHKVGFEGGQMPIQRRLPKFGFTSRKGLVREELRLTALNAHEAGDVTVESLRKAGLIRQNTLYVKIIATGEVKQKLKIADANVRVSEKAKAAIEAAGGTVE
ncbi:MAG: 50S ribosomal protein L15 [Gammaproteobacteria bacterium]